MIRRFAILLLSLSAIQCSAADTNLRATATTTRPNYAASHQRRELSWWSSLLTALHCLPPGPAHHQCINNHSSSGGGSSSSGGSGGSSSGGSSGSYNGGGGDGDDDGSSSSSYNGNGGGGNGGGDGDASNGGGNGGGNDDNAANTSNNNNNGGGGGDDTYGGGDDDGSAYFTADDAYSAETSAWGDDGWQESNLDNGGTKGSVKVGGVDASNIWPFIAGALVAGVIGAVLVVGRKRRQQEEENHPLEGSLKKRMKLFSGGVFRKKQKGALNDEIANGDGTPAFIEISSIRSGMSMGGGGDDAVSVKSSSSRRSNKAGSYKAPASPVEQPVIFENDSDESESQS